MVEVRKAVKTISPKVSAFEAVIRARASISIWHVCERFCDKKALTIHEERSSHSTGSETVHRSPDSGSSKVAETESDRRPPSRAIPYDASRSRCRRGGFDEIEILVLERIFGFEAARHGGGYRSGVELDKSDRAGNVETKEEMEGAEEREKFGMRRRRIEPENILAKTKELALCT